MEIKFTNVFTDIPEQFYPKPASECLPTWYKNIKPYSEKIPKSSDGYDLPPPKTIKKCMPVFDSITSGYIIFSAIDVRVTASENDFTYFQWPHSFYYINNNVRVDPIQFHDSEQVNGYPLLKKEEEGVAKFVNPWSIQTPKGYSVFITTPMHRDLPFEILPAIVDTDTNFAPVHFPFLLREKKWSGVIPSGTPIAQVIPFKRDSWQLSIGNEKDKDKSLQQVFRLMSSYTSPYKKMLWNKKSFK